MTITIMPGNAVYDELNRQPMVSFRNLLAEGTITDANLPSGTPRADAVTEDTSEYWLPAFADTLRATLATSTAADVCLIAAHTLGTAGARISVQYRGANRTNLILHSENITPIVTPWTLVGAAMSGNVAVSPSGTATAERITETAVSGSHHVFQNVGSLTANTTHTFSIYVKADGRNRGDVRLIAGSDSIRAEFNLATGTVQSGAAGVGVVSGVGIEALPDGWFRVRVTGIPNTTATAYICQINMRNGGGSDSYTGDGTSALLLWGAQLEVGATATSYVRTTTAAVTSDWYDAVSFYDPPDDKPFALIWPSVASTGWGIRLEVAAAQIGVAWIGPRLVIPGGVVPDYTPVWAAERVEKFPAITRRGNFRGQRIERSGATLSAQFMPVPHDFALNDMAAFRQRFNDGHAFVWASAPSVFPRDVAYCWADGDATLSPSIRAAGNLVNLTMQMEAYVGR